MNRNLLIAFGCSLLLAASCSLPPFHSEEFQGQFSEQALAQKASFLSQKTPIADTLRPPNIIILMADDLGYFDISLHGNTQIQTTHIDALARQGIACTRAYVSAPSCAPSRAGLITGRYQQRFGFENQLHERLPRNRFELFAARNFIRSNPWKIKNLPSVPTEAGRLREGLPPTEITLAEILKKRGYRTAIFGKWHLGSAPFCQPHRLGFDEHFGFYGSHSLFAPEGAPGMVDRHSPKDWTDKHIWSGQRNGDCAIVRNGLAVEEPGYLTQRFAEEAIRFLEENQNQPFFLFVPFSAPHTPFQAPEDYYARFSHIDDPVRRVYLAMIAALDDAVGDINKKVEELGLAQNTLIFFLSDNGGAEYTHATDNAPLNGGKITAFEGGLRVPFFLKWQGVLPAGTAYPHPVSALDIFTTVCAATHTALPEGRIYDGVNLLPYLLGHDPGKPHEALYWKGGSAWTILKNDWKFFYNAETGQSRLYKLADDPYEKANLAGKFPEKARALQADLDKWCAAMPKPLWPALVSFKHEDEEGVFYFDN
ncbi:MAG: sulfatase-like hydrolase/transferase [Lewinellaceae bacterium]|nr:sulfatase-like hydrolase/transferase [Lewinellaceae bacterium]